MTPAIRPPKKCIGCQLNRVAWVKPRVDYCDDCLPGGPFTPPPCRRCGSEQYFSDGKCERCHPGGPLYVGSCRSCLAWGVYRAHCWLCWACRWWQTHFPLGDCTYCGRNTRIGEQRACRLCLEQARMLQEPGRALNRAEANRHGQQLFIANLQFKRFPPRQHSRDPLTARIHIMGITPIIQAWAGAGNESLAEITPEHVRAAPPPAGSQRNWAEFGLRSLFTTLKRRKLIFSDPTRGMRVTPVNSTVPLPLDTQAIRDALNSPDPAIALAVALVAFHALTANQLRVLMLTDIVDGRLTLDGRSMPLADPVRIRLTAWLDHRARTWPNSIKPHLFIGRRSHHASPPVGSQFPWKKTNLRAQALREDRILQEIHATGGDVRRICDLFGLTVGTAQRYASTLNHPKLLPTATEDEEGVIDSARPDPIRD